MHKVKCINGHFYNRDRFGTCPICGCGEIWEESGARGADSETFKTEPLLPEEACDRSVSGEAKRSQAWVDELAPTEILCAEKEVPAQKTASECPPQREQTLAAEADPAVKEEPAVQKAASGLSEAVAATASKKISALPKTVGYYDLDTSEPPVGWLVCVKGVYLGKAFACKTGKNKIGRGSDMDINLMDDPSVSREPSAFLIYEPKQRRFFLQAGTGDGLVYRNGSILFTHEELTAYDKIELGNSEFVFVPLCSDRFTWDEYITKG